MGRIFGDAEELKNEFDHIYRGDYGVGKPQSAYFVYIEKDNNDDYFLYFILLTEIKTIDEKSSCFELSLKNVKLPFNDYELKNKKNKELVQFIKPTSNDHLAIRSKIFSTEREAKEYAINLNAKLNVTDIICVYI